MAAIAQLVEPWFVVPVVVGSSPTGRPDMQYPIEVKDNVFITWKELGETPLQALERLREQECIDASMPMTYAGRLDPLAEGELLILVGEECKDKERYLGLDKEYEVEILLGASTDTGDMMGVLMQNSLSKSARLGARCADKPKPCLPAGRSCGWPSDDVLLDVLRSFVGKVIWSYPAFSSKTVDGKPLFLWSLEGKIDEVEIPKRESEIYELELIEPENEISKFVKGLSVRELRKVVYKKMNSIKPVPANIESKRLGADFRRGEVLKSWANFLINAQNNDVKEFTVIKVRCKCSSGTYMRTLAKKIGGELGTGAMALSIVRTQIVVT